MHFGQGKTYTYDTKHSRREVKDSTAAAVSVDEVVVEVVVVMEHQRDTCQENREAG